MMIRICFFYKRNLARSSRTKQVFSFMYSGRDRQKKKKNKKDLSATARRLKPACTSFLLSLPSLPSCAFPLGSQKNSWGASRRVDEESECLARREKTEGSLLGQRGVPHDEGYASEGCPISLYTPAKRRRGGVLTSCREKGWARPTVSEGKRTARKEMKARIKEGGDRP